MSEQKTEILDPLQHTPLADREIEFQPVGETIKVKLTVALVRRFLCTPTKFGVFPGDNDVVKFMMLCEARGLNPWTGDAYLIGYQQNRQDAPKFNLITSLQALLKRSEMHEQMAAHKAGIAVVKDDQIDLREGTLVIPGKEVVIGGWAEVYRRDRDQPVRVTLQLSTYNKGVLRWKSDSPGMIRKCSLAAALREAFPNVTAGMYTADEMPEDVSLPAPTGGQPTTSSEIPPEQPDTVGGDSLFEGYEDAEVGSGVIDAEFAVKDPEESESSETSDQPESNEVIPEKEPEQEPAPKKTRKKKAEQKTLVEESDQDPFGPEDAVEGVDQLKKCRTPQEVSAWKQESLAAGSDPTGVKSLAEKHLATL